MKDAILDRGKAWAIAFLISKINRCPFDRSADDRGRDIWLEMHWFPSSIIFNHTTRKHRGFFLLGFYSDPPPDSPADGTSGSGNRLAANSVGNFAWKLWRWTRLLVAMMLLGLHLVGGWTNPSEKYFRQNGFIFPNFRDEHKEYLSCAFFGREVAVFMLVPPGWIWNRKRSGWTFGDVLVS